MRKMAKGAAIPGGVFAVLFFLFSILSIVSMFVVSANLAIYTVLTNLINMVTVLVLGIALFRGKADAFAAIVCLLNIPLNLWIGINNIRNISNYLDLGRDKAAFASGLNSAAAWVEIAVLILMVIQCFRKNGGKDTLCAVLGPVSAVLSVVAALGMVNVTNALLFEQESLNAIAILTVTAVTSGMMALLKKLPLALGALAIGLSKDVQPAAPYGQYGYQVPQQQNWQ